MSIKKNSIIGLILIYGTLIVSVAFYYIGQYFFFSNRDLLILLVMGLILSIPLFVGYGMLITQIKKQKREPLDYVYIVFATCTFIVSSIIDVLVIIVVIVLSYRCISTYEWCEEFAEKD